MNIKSRLLTSMAITSVVLAACASPTPTAAPAKPTDAPKPAAAAPTTAPAAPAPTTAPAAPAAKSPIIGLITKTETNPFFVKMREGANKMAADKGAKLLTGAGKADGDNAGQVAAIENMVAAGAQTILITPSDSKAIVPAIKKARDAGVMVIALDSPTEPGDAVDALFATDNYKAGVLIGQYAKAAAAGKAPKIATLDLFPGHPVGAQRHNGFLKGYGLTTFEANNNELAKPAEVVCMGDSFGDQAKGQTAMENCLQKNPDINIVYTINEPAAAGAYQALKNAGKEKDVVIVSVDGGCAGVANVEAGIIAATSQQYPLLMASKGVEAGIAYAATGKKVSGYTDTGVTLIAGKAVAGVESKDVKTGLDLCWGDKPAAGAAGAKKEAIIGLITKTETNPFFVKMREGANKMAADKGAKLLTGAGKADGDNAGQVAAIENMVAAGATTILITPSDSKAIVPAIKKARDAGVQVIALDSPTEPGDAVDALFATDNYKAGVLIGQYAKAALGAKAPKIVTLDLFPGHPVGAQRHNGFLKGYGLTTFEASNNELAKPAEVVCMGDSFGDQAKGQTAMENCLQKNPDVNIVYTINEPAAAGAYQALKKAGKEKDVVIVSVDGGCAGVANVEAGIIAATSQQYPLLMAAKGVEAGVAYAGGAAKVKGYTDTGVTLIAGKALAGVDSKDVKTGLDLCWGEKPAGAAMAGGKKEAIIGLITKTETNPFFVKMREGANKMAADKGAKLLTGAGKADGDNAGQVAAIENMVAAGATTILITPSDSKAIVPAIKKARDAGVQVIALDSPTEPGDAVDALFATDNYKAGVLIGQYAKAALAGKAPKIATLDLFPGHPVGAQRHNGFLKGYGLTTFEASNNELAKPAEVVCMGDSFGDQAKGQTAMENCLQKNPDINVVYTINEPAAAGAYQALKKAGKEKDVVIVSVDGGCAGVKNVEAGVIAATSQQYPLLMASKGVEAGVAYAGGAAKVSGYTDTGVTLIAGKALAGVDSKDVKTGIDLCWGDK